MISYVLVILAAFCNSVMDVISHHHSTSVFKNYLTGFWSDASTTSWKNKYIGGNPINGRRKIFWIINIPVQFTDAWHLMKSFSIIFFILAIVLYVPLFGMWIDFIALGFLWNIIFAFFYNIILKK